MTGGLQLKNISCRYPNGVCALNGVTASFAEHRVTALLGANGAGKTTLFRCILGVLPIREGQILLDGTDLRRKSPAELAGRIAYVPQTREAGSDGTVADFVLLGTVRTVPLFGVPGKAQRDAAEAALETLGLDNFRNRRLRELSGGEQQLVRIARALAQQADILLMDEPAASLDYGNQLRLMETVRGLSRKGYTVILSVHQPQLAMQYADEILALEHGSVLAEGGTDRLPDEALIRRLYGVNAVIRESDGKRILYGTAEPGKEHF